MKYRLLLFIGVIGVASLLSCGPLLAGEQDISGIDTDAVVITTGEPEDQPQWSSSLDGIEATMTTLLETNNKLGVEYRALNDEVTKLERELSKQGQTNKGLEEAIREKNGTLDVSAQAEEVKAQIAKTEKDIAQAKSTLADLKARQQRVDTRIELRRLKLKQLELDKQAALPNRNTGGNKILSSLEAEVRNLKDQVANQKEQGQQFQERIDALNNSNDQEAVQARQLSEENRSLKADLAKLTQAEQDLQILARGEVPLGTDPNVLANFQKYQELETAQRGLKEKTTLVTARKNQLDSHILSDGMTEKNLGANIKTLQEQNRQLEVRIENLRENIAVLDYKINSLESYRDRNKAN
jgi:chromosome segregation ATPase